VLELNTFGEISIDGSVFNCLESLLEITIISTCYSCPHTLTGDFFIGCKKLESITIGEYGCEFNKKQPRFYSNHNLKKLAIIPYSGCMEWSVLKTHLSTLCLANVVKFQFKIIEHWTQFFYATNTPSFEKNVDNFCGFLKNNFGSALEDMTLHIAQLTKHDTVSTNYVKKSLNSFKDYYKLKRLSVCIQFLDWNILDNQTIKTIDPCDCCVDTRVDIDLRFLLHNRKEILNYTMMPKSQLHLNFC
jgi:hypothetical protein